MKKSLAFLLAVMTALALLTLSAFAYDTESYDYYDHDLDGYVGVKDVVLYAKDLLNSEREDVNLVRILRVLKVAASTENITAYISQFDSANATATLIYNGGESVEMPFALLGIGADASESDYLGAPATFAVAEGTETFDADTVFYASKAFTATPVAELADIDLLNIRGTDGDHAFDDFTTASLEVSYRDTVGLSSDTTTYTRYDNAYYPRIKKVSDDLYVMFFMYSQLGRHLYVSTSSDAVNWSAPEVFWGADSTKDFTYEEGTLAGETDRLLAVNADACVLDNGDILCVYGVRPQAGYATREYIDYNGIYMRRGTVNADNTISWSDEQKIYTGQVWEPFIRQRSDGQIEVYWSSAVAYISMYGFDNEKRSTCTAMIVSNDNGVSWTPDIQPGNTNHYMPTRVFNQYVGDKIPVSTDGTVYTEAVPYYGGQMPSAAQLYNGKTLLAVEVHDLDDNFKISLATSGEGGEWKDLGIHEEGENMIETPFEGAGAGPYLARFPSGEVYLTYNHRDESLGNVNTLFGRMVSPDGVSVDNEFYAAEQALGVWGSSEVVGTHKVITAAQHRWFSEKVTSTDEETGEEVTTTVNKYGIRLVSSYLNHRINAPLAKTVTDGYTHDWVHSTDALFIGSESQAQMTLRAAHDSEKLYLLVTRFDYDLCTGDTAEINIAVGDKYYTVTADLDGNAALSGGEANVSAAVTVFGTADASDDTDEGAVIELAIAKADIGLSGATSFEVCPVLNNTDGDVSVTDTLTGVDTADSARWPAVVLD